MRLGAIITIILLCSTLLGAMPLLARAQSTGSELPFGGIHAFITQCTCGADSLHYIFDYMTDRPLALLLEPHSMIYANFNVIGGTYFLGTYQPSGLQCMMVAPDGCIGLPADGMFGVQPGTGTSFFGNLRSLAGVFSPILRGVSGTVF